MVTLTFEFNERGQHVISTHNEPLSVVMCVRNPDLFAP